MKRFFPVLFVCLKAEGLFFHLIYLYVGNFFLKTLALKSLSCRWLSQFLLFFFCNVWSTFNHCFFNYTGPSLDFSGMVENGHQPVYHAASRQWVTKNGNLWFEYFSTFVQWRTDSTSIRWTGLHAGWIGKEDGFSWPWSNTCRGMQKWSHCSCVVENIIFVPLMWTLCSGWHWKCPQFN